MTDHGFSERHACMLVGVNRSAWQYEPLRRKDDAVRERMREIADERRRFGYRRLAIPQEANQRWSLDFVSDALACGWRFRVLNLIDDYSRECLTCIVDTSLSGQRVVRELTALAEHRGLPCMVVSDNGTELTSHAVLAWCQDTGVEWHYIAHGKP